MANQQLSLQQIQEKGFCNWCRNSLTMSDTFSDKNFISTSKYWPATQSKAVAVYCSDCLAKADRVAQPKTAINRYNLDELNLDLLPDDKQEAKAIQKDRDQTLKATGADEVQEDIAKAANASTRKGTTSSKK